MTTYSEYALRELRDTIASIICPDLPTLEGLRDGSEHITLECLHTIAATLSPIAGRDTTPEIRSALEYAQSQYRRNLEGETPAS